MFDRPTIGVTGPNRGGFIAWKMTAFAIRRCGGKPIRITPSHQVEAELLHGLVIGGGTDVDPKQYDKFWQQKEENKNDNKSPPIDWLVGFIITVFRTLFALRSSQDYDPERDALEKSMIQHALYFDLPILGICRGAQLMNVVLGGTLHRNIEHFYTEDTNNIRSILPRKTIHIDPDSRLYRLLKAEQCRINALHDQSIDVLGDGVIISAEETSGVVQAIEKKDHHFFIGVQWHPEYMPQDHSQRQLFCALVQHSKQNGQPHTTN